MEYEQLLNDAFETVQKQEVCERFDVKKVAGHIEGSRTIISNFLQIASCLRRNPESFAKFLFKELATSGEIDGERLILSRKISSGRINEKIERYVNLFVLCPNCKKPDTEVVEEGGQNYIRCLACGNKKLV